MTVRWGGVLVLLFFLAVPDATQNAAQALNCREQTLSLSADGSVSVDSFDFQDWGSDATVTCSGSDQCILIAFVDVTSTPYVRISGGCYDSTNVFFYSKGVQCNVSDVMFASDGTYSYSCCDSDLCNGQNLLTANYKKLTENFLANCSDAEAALCTEKYIERYGCEQTIVKAEGADACAKYVWGGSGYGCLAEHCTCTCDSLPLLANTSLVDWEQLTPCQRERCMQEEEDEEFCAPGCNITKLNNGICDAFCMTPGCKFDGGDCLAHTTHYSTLSPLLHQYDTDADLHLSKAEYDALSSSSSSFPSLSTAEFDELDMEAAGSGLSLRELALTALSPSLPSLSLLTAAMGPEREEAFMEVALWVVGLADANADGLMDAGEAYSLYALPRHDYTMMNLPEPSLPVMLDEVAHLLRSVVDTLAGRGWEEAEEEELGVAARSVVALADVSRDGQVSWREAQALALPFHAALALDADNSGGFSVTELHTALLRHAAGPCPHLSHLPSLRSDLRAT
eukprot:CAMPEP_0181319396 /NCGR_PEP_ID=MMETSP1101-20121128/17546_1 /TAXON_ID=46948 /ORGANISM="Rhodomonas abbreviata, Strain Caron Lab Isolate" /LENGTH=509 /DNA_ID=CAMNT_0023426987 /DNA_START=33 /DNA_END=1558 /DNA_ORIENTATION=+